MTQVSAELREAAVSGARWTFPAKILSEAIAFVSTVVLARLVSPAEFGHAAVALVVVALTAILGIAGGTAPLVQRKELTSGLIGATVMICLTAGTTLTLATVGAAEFIVRPLFGVRTADLVLLASPAWLLVAVGAPSTGLLYRALRFKTLAVIETIAALLAATSAIAAAEGGGGGAAVVGGGVVFVGSSALLALAVVRPGGWRTDPETLRATLGFVTPLGMSSLVYIAYRNIDYAILGVRTTPAQVGYYWRAWQLGVNYQSKISGVIQWIAFPIFSRASDQDELRLVHGRIVRTHVTVLVPLLATFIGAAPVLIPWLFGEAWEPSVLPAQILALAGMCEAITTGVGPLMVALGRPGVLLRLNLVVLALFAVVVYLLAPLGIEAVAVGEATIGVLSVFAIQAFVRRPQAGLTFADLWTETRTGIVVGAVVLTVAVVMREVLQMADLSPVVVLGSLSGACALAYGLLLKAFFPAVWEDLRAIYGAVGRRKSESPDPELYGGEAENT